MDLDGTRNDEEQGSDDEEGNDMSTDSSEEEEDDPEEARKIQEGFIVDEDEEEEEEEEESDGEKHSREERRKRRKRHRKRDKDLDEDEDEDMGGELDEDDLELVEEATGHRPERASKSRLKRLRRAREETELDEELADLQDATGDYRKDAGDKTRLHDLWDDDTALRVQRRNEELDEDEGMFEDDMRGFIEADEDEEVNEMGDAERQERLERRRAEKERRRTAGGISELSGLDQNAIAMLIEVFGDGHEYDWALGDETDEVEEIKKDTKYTDVFEPSEIRSRMLTEDDDLIRAQDIPERMQLVTSSLTTDATLSLEPPLQPQDLNDAAYWVSLRLGQRIERDFFKEDGQFRRYLPMLITAVQVTLDQLFIQNLEVPYIATHKKDYIWHIDGANHIELLSVAELWRVYGLGQKFRAFQERKRALEATHSKLSAPDDYYKSDIQPKLDSMEAITDATEWLSMQHRLELQDATMIEEDGKTKRPTRISTYEMLKKSPIDHLVKDFCPPAREISRKVREVMQSRGSAVHRFLDDPVLPPMEHVIPYVDAEKQRLMEIERKRWATNPMAQNESSLVREVTAETMLERARLLIATELGKDPLLRQVVRTMFTNSAEMSCSPTDKGLIKIDETHPYYAFKYLSKKPIRSMTKSSQFLHVMAAEADHLVTVQVGIPEETRRQFVDDLRQAVSSDGYSDASRLWNEVRAQAVTEAVDKHFLPYGAKWIREWLREEVEDWVARKCGDELERRINVKPLFYDQPDFVLDYPSVMAISWGDGDPRKDPISVVFLGGDGRLRDHAKFDNLKDKDLENEFLGLIKQRKPNFIVIGGFSPATHRLVEIIRPLVYDPDWVKAQTEKGHPPSDPVGFDNRDSKNPLHVKFVQDAVARIFQHSKRAAEEFGTLSLTSRYCIGLARYAQSPLNEYAALGADVTAISFDQDAQHLVPREKLLISLERTLVNVVNKVGVDINRAVHEPYYQALLPFVSGLGPRKAQHLVRKVLALGNLINREQFVRDGIMTTKVWLNAASFLCIPQEGNSKLAKSLGQNREKLDFSEMPDPLDGTRLHPQDYELARKMALDALEKDEEDYTEEHPSAIVSLFMKEKETEKARKAALEVLSLDDFAQTLLESQKEQKRLTLDLIKKELQQPYGENRPSFILPDDMEILTMLSGETERSLQLGLILSVQVLRIKPNFIIVKLASNLEGIINATYLGEEHEQINPDRAVKVGQPIRARLIAIKPEEFYIELSARPSDLAKGDESYQRIEPDEYFNIDQAARDKEILQRKKNSQQNKARRMVKHPNFANMNSRQAEEHLAKQHRGDVVIRPSSKGPEHLAVTWKVDRNIYQHIDVLEVPVDANDPMAGYKYIVDHGREGQREFSDLDELIVNHVKAMARKVEELMAHDKYKHESPEQLANTLTMLMAATPDRSLYAFCLNPERPGYFNLMFKSNVNAPVVTWPVKVTPEAYVFFGEKLPSVPQLCDAFKMRHIGPLAGGLKPLPGGMTPHGARTPGGRMTPGVHRVPMSGRTPNPHQNPPTATPLHSYAPGMTTGPQLSGYGAPPPQTPSWGSMPPSQYPAQGGMPHMNPARAAMIQQSSGFNNQNERSGWGRR
ncbi:hypothetical protein CPB86DRAFT_871966 [Serendipita vermifera]|nr:hypothetical protein CPB86DRAFT_871966 [Serendipita vermifera]